MLEIISTVNVLLSTFKNIKTLYDKADYIELKSHILDMNEQILNMKEAALELRDENIDLKEKIKQLTLLSEKVLALKDGAYYDNNNNGPYCPTCYDNGKYLSLMCSHIKGFAPACPRCKYSQGVI